MLEDCEYATRSLNCAHVEVIDNIKCYIYTKKTQFHKKNPSNITRISVSIFGKSPQFWRMGYI